MLSVANAIWRTETIGSYFGVPNTISTWDPPERRPHARSEMLPRPSSNCHTPS